MQHDPHQSTASLSNAFFGISAVFYNGIAWAQSFNAGAIAGAITLVGGGLVGVIVLGFQKIGPEWIKYRTVRDDARNATLSGKMDALTNALGDAVEREKSAREHAEINREMAADAKELAEINRKIAEKSDLRNAELMVELKVLNEKFSKLVGQHELMGKRLEDANQKLHDFAKPLHAVVLHSHLAEQQADEISAKLDRTLAQTQANAGLTGKVDDKAAHVVEVFDGLKRDNEPGKPTGK